MSPQCDPGHGCAHFTNWCGDHLDDIARGCANERCDGGDGDGNGSVDEGCDEEDERCENYRTDPVHVGSGAFVLEPRVDVRFIGASQQSTALEFVRHYSSLDGWVPSVVGATTDGLAHGWHHTFDQRLFDADGYSFASAPVAGPATLEVVWRTETGRGLRFECPPPHDPAASDVVCAPSGGDPHTLTYVTAASEWVVADGAGVDTTFDPTGLLRARGDASGMGWSVTRHSAGPFAGLIDLVQDAWGRRIDFVWESSNTNELPRLSRIEDGQGGTLADFTFDGRGQLTAADSGAGSESYAYATSDGGARYWPYITVISRDGSPSVTVDYIFDADYSDGRVRSIVAPDGTYEFRYANEANNRCNDLHGMDESRTSMVIDRSEPGAPSSCVDDASCPSGHACSAGSCHPFTCQEYVQPGGATGVSFTAVGAIAGDCPCGGSSDRTWTRLTTGAVVQTSRTARDGTVTTFDYDAEGRLTARCVGDADGDGDPNTCASAGAVWTAWTYDAVWPSKVALEQRRSALVPGGQAETEYEHDPATGRLRFVRRRGYTRDLADNLVGPVKEITEYRYDTSGRLEEVLSPDGGRTVYTYWPSGGGNESGLLRYEDRYATATAYLRTEYADYTSTGRARQVTAPDGVLSTYTFDSAGRVTQAVVGGLTSTFQYDAAGRLATITEPTGREVRHFYDAYGRLERREAYDTSGTGWADRVRYEYDEAGRTTAVHAERLDAGGALWSTTYTWTADYDNHGYRVTDQRGALGQTVYGYDANAMGYLASVTRGDGDLETYGSDLLGRVTSIERNFVGGSSGTHALLYGNESGAGINTGGSRPTRVTDPGGMVRDYVYDDFGRLVRSSSNEWGVARWRYVDGQLTEEVDPHGRRTAYQHDLLGRVTLIDRDADNPSLLGQDYQFDYDNGDGAVDCPTFYGCTNRVGRLARVGIEYQPGSFWSMFYDYVEDGSVGSEMYPDGSETLYEYDSLGRMSRMQFPAQPADRVRFEYDSTPGDHLDPSEVTRIVHERTGSGDLLEWARSIERDSMGRANQIRTHDDAPIPMNISYRPDGRISCLWAYRRSFGSSVGVVDRCYTYTPDGMTSGHDSLVTGDAPRTYLYDGANRLTCSASVQGLSSCPTPGTADLIESYTYDSADNRVSMGTSSGNTVYSVADNAVADELRPDGSFIVYGYDASGSRAFDQDQSLQVANERTYVYDGDGRLSVVTVWRGGANKGSAQEQHTLSILYDHNARPLMVVDKNEATGVEEYTSYFWNLRDELINRTVSDSASPPGTVVVDSFVPIEGALLGRVRAEYQSGSGTGEEYLYYALQPNGLPVAGYAFDPTTGNTAEHWRAEWGPFGTGLQVTTTDADVYGVPHRFEGQLELAGADVTWWESDQLQTSRSAVSLNRYRVLDPELGQYLQPEPLVVEATTDLGVENEPQRNGPRAYARLAPLDLTDPDGYLPVWPFRPADCARLPWLPGCGPYLPKDPDTGCKDGPSSAATPPPPPPPEASGSCSYPHCRDHDSTFCADCCSYATLFPWTEASCIRNCCSPLPFSE